MPPSSFAFLQFTDCYSPQALEQHLLDELGLGLLPVLGHHLVPVLPRPAELEVRKVVAEPRHQPEK